MFCTGVDTCIEINLKSQREREREQRTRFRYEHMNVRGSKLTNNMIDVSGMSTVFANKLLYVVVCLEKKENHLPASSLITFIAAKPNVEIRLACNRQNRIGTQLIEYTVLRWNKLTL